MDLHALRVLNTHQFRTIALISTSLQILFFCQIFQPLQLFLSIFILLLLIVINILNSIFQKFLSLLIQLFPLQIFLIILVHSFQYYFTLMVLNQFLNILPILIIHHIELIPVQCLFNLLLQLF